MTETCPHCGTVLPGFQDAFCPECRGPLAEEWSQQTESCSSHDHPVAGLTLVENRRGRNPLGNFTLPARIVVVLSIVAAASGTAAYIDWAYDDLPPGSYPLWFFAMPVAVAVGLLCAACLALLRACGVPVYRQDAPASSKEGDQQATEPGRVESLSRPSDLNKNEHP
jgi:hypothetical protein